MAAQEESLGTLVRLLCHAARDVAGQVQLHHVTRITRARPHVVRWARTAVLAEAVTGLADFVGIRVFRGGAFWHAVRTVAVVTTRVTVVGVLQTHE